MKKPILPLSQCALLVACLMTGIAQAQSINLTGDTNPTGNLGGSYTGADMVVGNTATGTLDITSGAVMNTGSAILGETATGYGTATLSGGSQWTSGNLSVGKSGSGVLTISNGGKLISTVTYIGSEAGSNGTVTVDGLGSSLTTPSQPENSIYITAGTLRVLNGGTAVSYGKIYAAPDINARALIEIDGVGSTLGGEMGCNFGFLAPATVRVTNGGLLHCGKETEIFSGSVTVSSGSRLQGDDYIMIGPDVTLNIDEGSAVAANQQILLPYTFGDATLMGKGTLNINGVTTPGSLQGSHIQFGDNGLGALNFNHTDNSGNYAFSVPILGTGTVNVTDSGITTLNSDYAYTGHTNVNAGVLRAGTKNSLSPTSDFAVALGGTLDTNTFSPTVKSLSNAGTVNMLNGGADSLLTVSGNYVGNGGSIQLNTVLGADNSATQKLVVNGDTSGTGILNINNLGGLGAPTVGNGILVVQVDGASNGTFSLPAPGYMEVGGFRYLLVKTGNNWYLSSSERTEASPVEASVACTPSQLGGSAGLVATCTVSLNAAPLADFPVNLNLPATSPRYTTTCGSPIVVAANATQASCTITALPSTSPDDGDVMAELSIAPPTVADAYAASGAPAQVQILGNGTPRPGAGAHAVPTMGTVGLVAMASLMGLMGLRRSRKHNGRQG